MCKPLKQSELDKIHHGKEVTSATFILAERGGCSFTTKVRNVEDAGASLAIIIDNKEEDVEMVNMVDDGAGAGIRIPSMLVSKRDGQRMIDYIRSEQRKA
jgi:signal peptide peptidase-like protein 2B